MGPSVFPVAPLRLTVTIARPIAITPMDVSFITLALVMTTIVKKSGSAGQCRRTPIQ
jgi:hypothetical protein